MFAYGPIPSRRFGRSVGVSPIPPKTCTYSCVYCQLGRTSKLTMTRESFFAPEQILKDIEVVIKSAEEKIDFITFVGDGEPTLNKDLGSLISHCRNSFPYKTAVITNGSLLWMDDVRDDLSGADVVNITLSVSDDDTFSILHRPHRNLNFQKVLDGVTKFASFYKGEIWIEVMLVDGINTGKRAMKNLETIIDDLNPSNTFVMTPIRPPAEPWVKVPSKLKLIEAMSIFNGTKVTESENGAFGTEEFASAKEAIIETSLRHPLRIEQGRMMEDVFNEKVIDTLLNTGVLESREYEGKIFILPKNKERNKL
ncbi:MAG: radical SAM protein [bacterium]